MSTMNPTLFRSLPLLALAAAALTLAILLAPLTAQAAAPGTPDSVAVARSNGTLTATWDAVNGATSYHVTYSSDNGASWSLAALDHPASGGGAESIAIGGVDNAETYLVGVLAKNANGSGAWRNSEPAGPYTPPPPPAAVGSISVARSNGTLTASWDAVDGATKHHVTYSSDNGASWSLAALEHPSNSITVTGVENGATYIVGVRTGNDGGWSGWVNSPASGPYTPPPTPTPTPTPAPAPSVTAERNDDGVSASVSWTAYAGDDFSYYRVIVCTDAQYDGSSCSGTVHKSAPVYDAASTGPVSVTGLEETSGYGVILQTWRTGGALKSHATLAAVPAPADAPSNFTVTNGDGYYDLDWDAVSGATAYDVRAKIANNNAWSSVATGVTATSYRYTTPDVVNVLAVRGGNASGAGPWAELSRMPSGNWLNVVIQGGASAQSAQGQSQLAAPASITVTRENHPRDEKLYVTWAAVSGAGGYNLACAASPSTQPLTSLSWWHCGSVDSGSTTTFTVDHDKRGGRTRDLGKTRSYAVAVRAVTSSPADASPWLMSADAHPAYAASRETFSASRAAGSVSVSWARPDYAQGYKVYCATYENNAPGTYTLCANVSNATAVDGRYSATISAWTAGGADYTVDDAKSYVFSISTTNAWGESYGTSTLEIQPNMVSNLASTKIGDSEIFDDYSQAVAFSTGPNSGGYVLKSVTVPLRNPTNTRGLTMTLHAMKGSGQYSSSSAPSDTALPNATLSGTAPTTGTWTDTTWTCSGSGCNLSPGKTYFVVASNGNTNKIFWAYATTETETALPSDNGWSVGFDHYKDGSRAWSSWSSWNIAKIVFATNPSLDASNIGTHGATLTIANHGGVAWYYKHTNTGATCDGPVAAGTSTKALTNLTAGTSYTYSAYSDSSCTTGNLLATASAFTTPVTVSNLSGSLYLKYKVGNYLQVVQQGAQAFTTGSNTGGYTLSSIEIRIDGKVGSPTNLVVTLHSASGSNPDTATTLATLSGNSSPSSANVYPYTCSGSGCALAKDTTYFVLMKAAGSPDASYYEVDLTSAAETKQPPDNGWSIADKGRDGFIGNWYDMQAAVKMKVTAVPK